ncbi:hypothetical protein [Campylobacter concisus]|nr:hypothetical protein [Campylobacter concisus]
MKEYNSLFINNEKNLAIRALLVPNPKQNTCKKINELRKILYEKCGDKYEIVDDLH